MNVYLLFEGDGTAIQAGPKLVGATLNLNKAQEWRDSLPKGSWEYRSIRPMGLRWTDNEEGDH